MKTLYHWMQLLRSRSSQGTVWILVILGCMAAPALLPTLAEVSLELAQISLDLCQIGLAVFRVFGI